MVQKGNNTFFSSWPQELNFKTPSFSGLKFPNINFSGFKFSLPHINNPFNNISTETAIKITGFSIFAFGLYKFIKTNNAKHQKLEGRFNELQGKYDQTKIDLEKGSNRLSEAEEQIKKIAGIQKNTFDIIQGLTTTVYTQSKDINNINQLEAKPTDQNNSSITENQHNNNPQKFETSEETIELIGKLNKELEDILKYHAERKSSSNSTEPKIEETSQEKATALLSKIIKTHPTDSSNPALKIDNPIILEKKDEQLNK